MDRKEANKEEGAKVGEGRWDNRKVVTVGVRKR
jgi:hypothetical protein